MNKPPIWDRLRTELDRAGRAAQGAIDGGKLRLDAYRARQLADKAAQALGYAVYRARAENRELEADTYARLASALAGHEAEAARLEHEARATKEWEGDAPEGAADAASPTGADTGGGPAAGTGESAEEFKSADTPPPPA